MSKTNIDVPPFGHSTQLRIFIDPDSLQYDTVNDFVWAAAGTLNYNFAIAPKDLLRVSNGVLTHLKRMYVRRSQRISWLSYAHY